MCSRDRRACVSVRACVAFLLTAHFAFKGHLVIGAASSSRGASVSCVFAPTLTFVAVRCC